jgi:WYL domain
VFACAGRGRGPSDRRGHCGGVAPRVRFGSVVFARLRPESQRAPDLRPCTNAERRTNGTSVSQPKPEDRDIERLFQNSFQIWQNEDAKLERTVLRFSGRATQLVRERNWHASQRLQELANGDLEVGLTLNSLEEIVPWILSWGRQCEVVRPASLQRFLSAPPLAGFGRFSVGLFNHVRTWTRDERSVASRSLSCLHPICSPP